MAPTSVSVQHHVPQGIDLLDGVSVVRPHVVEFGKVLGNKFVGRLIGPEVGIPVRVHVQAALAHFVPFRVGGRAGAQRDVVEDRRNSVGVWGGAGLVYAVVRKGDIEVVVLGRDVEASMVPMPDQRKRGKRPGVVQEASRAPEDEEHEGKAAGKEAGVCPVDTCGQRFYPHLVAGNEEEWERQENRDTAISNGRQERRARHL